MRRVATVSVFILLLFTSLVAQQPQGQQGLTEAMVTSAAVEVPRLVELLALKPGMTVADVGAGFGAWTVAFGKWTGASGRVFATDIGEKQLAFLREYTKKEGLTNVTVHLTQPQDILTSMASALKPGGRLAVIDFPPRPNSEVPAGVPANRRGHGVPPDVVVQEANTAGFTTVSMNQQWSAQSQPNDLFLLVFRKN